MHSIRERKGQEVVSEKGVGVLKTSTAAKEKPPKPKPGGGA